MPAKNVSVNATFEPDVILDEDFESYDVEDWWTSLSTETSSKELGKLVVAKGYDAKKTDDNKMRAGIANDTSKVLYFVNGKYGTADRGNKIKFDNLGLPNVADLDEGKALSFTFKTKIATTGWGATITGITPRIEAGAHGFKDNEWADVTVIINKDKSGYMAVKTGENTVSTDITLSGETLTGITLVEQNFDDSDHRISFDDMKIAVVDKPYTGEATITVKETTEQTGIDGATVAVSGQELTTNGSGEAKITLPEGKYDVAVSKTGYISPKAPLTLEVKKDQGGTLETTLTKKVATTLTVTPPHSTEVAAGDLVGITYTAEVKDQEEGVMTAEEAPVTWTIYNESGDTPYSDGKITVTDGNVVAQADAAAGTYTLKANAGGNTSEWSGTFTVAKKSPAKITVNYQHQGTTVATKVIEAAENAAYVDTEFDLQTYDEGKWSTTEAPINVDTNDGETYKVLTIEGGNTFTVTPEDESSAVLNINVTPKGVDDTNTHGKDYYYFDDFENGTDRFEQAWNANMTQAKINERHDTGTPTNYWQNYNNDGERSGYYKFKNMKSIEGDYTLEMDIILNGTATNDSTKVYFCTANDGEYSTSALPGEAAHVLSFTRSSDAWSINTEDPKSVATIGKGAHAQSGSIDDGQFAHLKIEVKSGEATLTITGKGYTDHSDNTGTDITDITGLKLTVAGESNVITGFTMVKSQKWGAFCYDNIEIYKPATE